VGVVLRLSLFLVFAYGFVSHKSKLIAVGWTPTDREILENKFVLSIAIKPCLQQYFCNAFGITVFGM
jgi:hypothetical protein